MREFAAHSEVPNPLPAGSRLWVEVEDDTGAAAVGGFDLRISREARQAHRHTPSTRPLIEIDPTHPNREFGRYCMV
ncbi:MAG: hypothetical protein SFZ23_10420 [Planctomycetota bacterium]|nr:hypothetical protein [Planctomycetota bacterium]